MCIRDRYSTDQNDFEFKCDQEGRYLFDIVVNWADGSEFNQDSDFYTTSVNVGEVEEDTSETKPETQETVDEGLPSISLLTVIVSITILVISRRQR